MPSFSGALTALVTPFRDESVDEQALRDLVEAQIAAGIHGLVPCGTTGENVALSEGEYARVIQVVVSQAKGRVPVLAGAGTNSTRHTIALSRIARDAQVDGLLLVVPYYNRPTQRGLFAHFKAVVEAVTLPTVLYNIPGRAGVDMSVDTLERLCELEAIVGIKESTGTVGRSAEIATRLGDRLAILSGDDALTLPIMAVGGQGVISVTSNVAPQEVVKLVELARAGDFAAARAQHQRLSPLFDAMFRETSPGPVKAGLALQGRLALEYRLPMVPPAEEVQTEVRNALTTLGLL